MVDIHLRDRVSPLVGWDHDAVPPLELPPNCS
jgi:hypothetical protein